MNAAELNHLNSIILEGDTYPSHRDRDGKLFIRTRQYIMSTPDNQEARLFKDAYFIVRQRVFFLNLRDYQAIEIFSKLKEDPDGYHRKIRVIGDLDSHLAYCHPVGVNVPTVNVRQIMYISDPRKEEVTIESERPGQEVPD